MPSCTRAFAGATPIKARRVRCAAEPAGPQDGSSLVGVPEVLMAIFGEEFVKNFPLMTPPREMRAMERALNQTKETVEEKTKVGARE